GLIFSFGVLTLLIIIWNNQKPKEISYNQDIRPIINTKCISCHGGVKQSAGLSFLFEAEAKAPTESGKPATIPRNSKSSEIIRRLTHSDSSKRMHLDRDRLSKTELQLIAAWIDQGAKWEDHCAYLPPDTTLIPPSHNFEHIAENGIDHFIFRQLEKMDLMPSPLAEKELLLRRVYLDLIGLPPTEADYKDYLS